MRTNRLLTFVIYLSAFLVFHTGDVSTWKSGAGTQTGMENMSNVEKRIVGASGQEHGNLYRHYRSYRP